MIYIQLYNDFFVKCKSFFHTFILIQWINVEPVWKTFQALLVYTNKNNPIVVCLIGTSTRKLRGNTT